ncbi:GDSL esterase lipase At2g30310-like [Olea europaea subsp. europaea]|uniref:GDSL esterase lipase At2g30310-like n=2 Tax=Olea europaea subsp. europaea TaxID=158383 RepID=A0A8S0R9S2_OLEEU|nr:GDSL esterase lipase At2g30310-like [Olea europaea subsp. europaea]
MVAGLPPLGCGQGQSQFSTCLDPRYSDSQTYNQKLVGLLPKIQATLPGSKLVYADLFTPFVDMIINPTKYGFLVTTRGCCGTGTYETGPLCSPVSSVCSNPAQYLFWDSLHPTQAAAGYISQYLHTNSLSQF